ncbi:hypothetical protein ACI2L1_34660 [Streptomyces sp. NPDC019531]|uniref:hypothetical protein n=1 Tax=Streptomyces sp. NPDC019531 TaxID=3365062 RepID=UPI003850AE0B
MATDMRVSPLVLFVVGMSALVALTGCGGGKAKDDGVASINDPNGSGGSAKAGADPDAGRPQIRLDSTQEDITRLWDAFSGCMKENGAPNGKAEDDSPAMKACRSKLPLNPPELDPAKNPKYSDGARAMVKCMNDHGIKSVIGDNGLWGLESGNSLNAPNYASIETDCQVKAFGGDK